MTKKSQLLRSQKNLFFKALESRGINPLEFEWIEKDVTKIVSGFPVKREALMLRHKDMHELFFEIDFDLDYYTFITYPIDYEDVIKSGEWGIVQEMINAWTISLTKELGKPDLWAEAEKYQSIFTHPITEGIQEIPFTHTEAEQIASALKQIEEKVINEFNPDPKQIAFIKKQSSYLEAKAKTGNSRIDWLHILMTVIINIAIHLSLSPEKAHILFAFYKEALNPIVHLLLG